MLRDERTERRAWVRSVVVGLCLGLGLALPAQGQDEPVTEETPPIEVTVVPDPNDQVVILSNGVPATEVRIRQPEVRTYENLHPIGELTDPASIPTRGMSSQAVDTIYHGTVDYGEPSGIRTRGIAGSREYQPITTHGISDSPDESRIRYHGGFR
jgi:hypothetical protein